MNRQIRTYGTQQVMSTDPVTLVALLYDKAVLSLRAAAEAAARNEIERRWQANGKAVEIIKHLLMTLDMEKGGQVAANLEAVYAYMLRRLVDVDIKNDARAAEEVIELLEPLRASWSELARVTREMPEGDPALKSLAAAAREPARASEHGAAAGPAARPAPAKPTQGKTRASTTPGSIQISA